MRYRLTFRVKDLKTVAKFLRLLYELYGDEDIYILDDLEELK